MVGRKNKSKCILNGGQNGYNTIRNHVYVHVNYCIVYVTVLVDNPRHSTSGLSHVQTTKTQKMCSISAHEPYSKTCVKRPLSK